MMDYHDLVHSENRSDARDAVQRLLEIARHQTSGELPSCQQVQKKENKLNENKSTIL